MSIIVKNLRDFIGIHKDSNIIVCGCGQSLLDIKDRYSEFITIGVNDVPALFDPTYLLVTDSPNRFQGKRKDLVNNSKAKHLFTCVSGWRHPSLVNFKLGTKDLKCLDMNDRLDHYVNSPYVAVNLAYKLGAKNIGMIGVDFTSGHFYNPEDGQHPVVQINYLTRVNQSYQKLHVELLKRGTNFYNLSHSSKIEIPKITIEDFSKLCTS